MTVKPGASSKVRAMRVLTLVCFFHFSGLNNGFCLMAEQSGRLQSADFAPYLLQKIAWSLRPAHLKAAVSRRGWTVLITRSGRVIRTASRQAVQGMLVESSFFQIWAGQCLKPLQPAFRVPGPEPDASAVSAPPAPELGGKAVYLHPDCENAWLKVERYFFWDPGQKLARWKRAWSRPGAFFGSARFAESSPAVRSGRGPRAFRPAFRRSAFHESSGEGDDDPALYARDGRS